MVITRATVSIDGEYIMKNGRLRNLSRLGRDDYTDFGGDLPSNTMVGPLARIEAFEHEKSLYSMWRGGTGKVHIARVGDRLTSKLAARAWSAMSYRGTTIDEIHRKTGMNITRTSKVVAFLKDRGLLQILPQAVGRIEVPSDSTSGANDAGINESRVGEEKPPSP